MGNSPSLPEKVLSAVQKNDVTSFQSLAATFSAAATADPAMRARVLEHRDKSGRTPLLIAAAKNHYQILQQLITLGANIHYINPARDAAGGALHEAAARRQEAAVELLLAAGANPFAANAAGRTALDEAVLSGHTGVVRAIEKYAEFTGMVGFKTRAMGGLSHKYKARWAVLMPYVPFHREGSGAGGGSGGGGGSGAAGPAPKPRRCLWLYKDKTSVSPRCRLWVDGATVVTHGPAGTEGTLRLHTSHGDPLGDLCTSYNHGYCVSMRPADLTPAAATTYQRLVSLINLAPSAAAIAAGLVTPAPGPRPSTAPPAPSAGLAPPPAVVLPPLPAFPGAGSPMAAPRAAPVVVPGPYYPLVPPMAPSAAAAGAAAGYMFLPPHAQPQPQPQSPASSSAYPNAAGPCPMASPLSLHQHQQQQQQRQSQAAAAAQGSPAAASTAAAAAAQPGGRPGSRPSDAVASRKDGEGPLVGSGGEVIDGVFIERMSALPGESDEAFAARLASAISATSGQSQQALYTPSPSAQPAPGPTQLPQALSQQPRPRVSGSGGASTSAGGTFAGGGNGASAAAAAPAAAVAGTFINFQSDPGNNPESAAAAGVRPAQTGRPAGRQAGLDELDIDAVNALIAADTAATSGGLGPSGGGAGASASSPSGAGCGGKAGREEEAPSAPPAEALMPAAARPPPAEADVECVICMSAPKEVGFLHGDTVHRCVCRACAAHVPIGSPCPLCRAAVERVLGVY